MAVANTLFVQYSINYGCKQFYSTGPWKRKCLQRKLQSKQIWNKPYKPFLRSNLLLRSDKLERLNIFNIFHSQSGALSRVGTKPYSSGGMPVVVKRSSLIPHKV
jgi:hypothetical protein